jgi:nickel/cobalt transporter (NiCoT) family protein
MPMISYLRRSLAAQPQDIRTKLIRIYAALLMFNIFAWSWAFITFHGNPVLWGAAFLAYSFGLRHAVDADHIAAIDNVTRTMMQEGEHPVTVGLMFSLGHSTVVVAGSMTIALAAFTLQHHIETFRQFTGLFGTFVSTVFLFGIGIANTAVLYSTYQSFRRIRRGDVRLKDDSGVLLSNGSFANRLFQPVFRMISHSWHMYPLGILFGLGFDTASEIGLLGIAATEASRNLPLWPILVFPTLFAASMSLIDTTDNILMLVAYGWAFVKPIRKLYYNITITLVSVLVAFMVGTIESIGLFATRFHLTGAVWNLVTELNNNYSLLGYCIIALFVACWTGSILIYKWRGFEQIGLE